MSENEHEPVASEGAPEEAQEEAWSGPSPEEWQQVLELQQAQNEWIQRQAAAQGQGERQPFDAYADPEEQERQLRALIREETSAVAEQAAQAKAYQEEQQMKAAEEYAINYLSDLSKSGTEFDVRDARIRADSLMHEMVMRYGPGWKTAEKALEEAAKQQVEIERERNEAYHQRKINELQGLRGVPREPAPSGTSAAAEIVTPEGGDELDLVRTYFPTAR